MEEKFCIAETEINKKSHKIPISEKHAKILQYYSVRRAKEEKRFVALHELIAEAIENYFDLPVRLQSILYPYDAPEIPEDAIKKKECPIDLYVLGETKVVAEQLKPSLQFSWERMSQKKRADWVKAMNSMMKAQHEEAKISNFYD